LARSRDKSFWEWEQEQQRLDKAPASGGIQTPVNAGYGMSGPPGNTASYAPTGPAYRRSGNQGLPAPDYQPGLSPNSKYTYNAPSQPQPWIDDVDMGASWWSPFQPVWPYGPPWVSEPREWNYPVGYNLNYIPQRMQLMAMLRGMRASWGVLATIIATRQDQLLRIPWTIQRKDKPRASSVAVDEMKKFFKRPDGKLSYSQWTRKLTDDLLVLDAPSIYFARDRRGRPLHAEVLDGATIFPLIDDAGRRPDSIVELTADGMQYLRRQPAFQQIIYGLPMIDLDESELMYVPMRPRADMPMFGYPGTEQILVEASEAVTKTFYQLNFWREGTIPDLIVTVPKEWSPRQIAMYQAHFDALLSGNINLKSKVRFLPGDSKPFDIKNSSGESLWSQRDETLVRLACYAYSVSPAPFIKMLNRSTAQNAQQMAEEEGLWPLMSYWKDDIIDPIIERFGYEDIEFTFLPKPEPDQEKAAKIHDMKIKNGEYSINEARGEDGLEPVPGGDIHLIYIGNAVVPLSDAVAGHAMPMQGGEPGAKPAAGPSGAPKPATKPTNAPLRGPARTTSTGEASSTQKTATPGELADAVDQAQGGLDEFSHLVLHQGNYPKGHIWIQGLNVSIENAPGSTRGEKDQSGVKWQVKMPSAYGYIRGTIGADGDQIDCYLGDNPKSKAVWVIDQNRVSKKGKLKGFDEHKVLLCYDSLESGLRDYLLSHFDGHGHDQISAIVELSMKEFKDWLANGDLKKPIADQKVGEIVLKAKDLRKVDTISSATGLNYYSQFAARPPKKRHRKKQGSRWLQLRANSPSPIV
jgi:Inorganic Pyrophosphatase